LGPPKKENLRRPGLSAAVEVAAVALVIDDVDVLSVDVRANVGLCGGEPGSFGDVASCEDGGVTRLDNLNDAAEEDDSKLGLAAGIFLMPSAVIVK
jgi:hypothetical protein